MVDVTKLENGDNVHYAPEHYKKDNKFENGVVKSISQNGGVFVVYNCGGEWHKYMDYTAAKTNHKDLFLEWRT